MTVDLEGDLTRPRRDRSPEGCGASRAVQRFARARALWRGILVTALRRGAQLGNRWPMLLAGSGSVVIGLVYVMMAAAGHPRLGVLAIYAATGGVEFVIQSWLIARRRHDVIAVPA